jgi:ABC-2 type transport system ATP-binding protein
MANCESNRYQTNYDMTVTILYFASLISTIKTTILETILSITNLSKRFGSVQALKDVSFEIKKGHVYGILGPNGSGKSTTLGIILNVVNKTLGEYSWFGGKIKNHDALKKVGAILERPNFYPYMTAQENLRLVCKIKNISYAKIIDKLQLVGLDERKDSKFSTFSLGMKQRLAIASALLNDPEILVLDEPTNGLDAQGISQIRDIIKNIALKGTTILLASHLLDEVEKVCSHVVVLSKGILLYSGSVNGISSNEGYFELQAEDSENLMQVLKTHAAIESIKKEEDKVFVYLGSPLEAAELNKFLCEKNINLSHLVKRKHSLEEQFLELTKNATPTRKN